MNRDQVIGAILSCFPPLALKGREADLAVLVDEFLGSLPPVTDVLRDDCDTAEKVLANIKRLRISLIGFRPEVAKALGRGALDKTLKTEEAKLHNAIARWDASIRARSSKMKKRGAPKDVLGTYLANWAVIFFERLTNRAATNGNARELASELFQLFARDSKRSATRQLRAAIETRNDRRHRRAKRLTA